MNEQQQSCEHRWVTDAEAHQGSLRPAHCHYEGELDADGVFCARCELPYLVAFPQPESIIGPPLPTDDPMEKTLNLLNDQFNKMKLPAVFYGG